MSDLYLPTQVIVIDPAVSDWKTLTAGLSPDIPVILLPEGGNGLQALADALAGYGTLDALHLVSHGSAGTLQLGDLALNASGLGVQGDALAAIASHLTPDSDVLLYGCSVAAGSAGMDFVNALSLALNGADIAASDDRTGPLALGGDWDLEVGVGEIETVLPFTVQGMQGIDECLGCYYDWSLSTTICTTPPPPPPSNSSPVNNSAPTLSGTAQVGNTLLGAAGNWSDANGDTLTYSYQWYRADDNSGTNASAISGATLSSLGITANDAHRYLRLIVTANDGRGGSASASSAWTAVTNSAPVSSVAPSVSGTSAPGNALSASTGTWTDRDSDSLMYSYQWYRASDSSGSGSAAIAGATSGNYTLLSSDAGSYVRVTVTANDSHGSANQSASSSWVAVQQVPTVSSIVRTGGASSTVNAAATSVSYTITFSESVTGVNASDFSLTATGTASGSIASVSGGGTTYSVVADALSGDGTLRLDLNGSGTGIENGAGISLASGYNSGSTYTLDHTAPSAPATPDMTSGTDSGRASTDDVTRDTTPTFTGTAEANSTVTLLDSDGTTVLGTATATGGNWSITATALSEGSHAITARATDAAGNASVASSALSVTIDTTAPAVSSVAVPANATYIAGQSLVFTLNFDSLVDVNLAGDTPRLALIIGSQTVYADYESSSANSLTFRYTLQAGDADTDGIAVGELQANGCTMRDAAGNEAPLALNGVGSTSSVLVDTTGPTVSSVAVPADATYRAGQNLDFTLNFDSAVLASTGDGTPRLALTVGSQAVYADYLGGSGTSALSFRYIVQAGDTDANGIAVGALEANGGRLQDNAGNDAILTLSSVGSTSNVLVDTTAPAITSVAVPADATYQAGDHLDFSVHFDSAVTVNTAGGTPRVALTIGGTTRYASYQSGTGSDTLIFRHTVQAGDADTNGITVGALAANGGTLRDIAGNDATLTLNSVGSTNGVLVETPSNPPPSVTNTVPMGGIPVTQVVTDHEEGTQTSLTVPVITRSLLDAAQTRSSVADIPLVVGDANESLLTVGLPMLFSMQTNAYEARTADLVSILIQQLDVGRAPALAAMGLHLAELLPSAEMVHMVSVVPETTVTVTTPIIFEGPSQSSPQAIGLVIDTTALQPNSVVRLDHVDFAAVIGSVRLIGGEGSNYVIGDGGSQNMFLGADDDELHGGGGDDVVRSKGGNDKLYGDDGNDMVGGGSGHDSLYGGSDNDSVYGGSGNDLLQGGDGDDVLDGGSGWDTASYADAGSAVTVTLDKIRVGGRVQAAQDTLGAGVDMLRSIENLAGSNFNDSLGGNGGKNRLDGGDGDDVIDGGGNADTLIGGAGEDTLAGGAGRDKFRYASVAECGDHVVDFSRRFDKFEFASDAFGLPTGKLAADAFLLSNQHVAQTAAQRFLFDTSDYSLYFDADGNGAGDAVLVAVLDNHVMISAANLIIV